MTSLDVLLTAVKRGRKGYQLLNSCSPPERRYELDKVPLNVSHYENARHEHTPTAQHPAPQSLAAGRQDRGASRSKSRHCSHRTRKTLVRAAHVAGLRGSTEESIWRPHPAGS